MKKQLPLPALIVRDVSGEPLSAAETARVRAWMDENPAHARMLAHLRDAQWRMQEWDKYKEVDKQAVWAQMQSRVSNDPGQPPLPDLEHPDWLTTPPGNHPTPGAASSSAFQSYSDAFRY